MSDIGVLSPMDQAYLRTLLRDQAAIEIGEERDTLLLTRLTPLVKRRGLESLAELVRRLRMGDKGLEHDVIDEMTTNETSFFRDRAVFDDLICEVVPELIAKAEDRPVTIWSAASSSGQEIYSLGMQLDQKFPGLVKEGRFRLLATDLSATMVTRVREGRYSELEIRRGMPDDMRDRYFDHVGSSWVVRPLIRDIVMTRQLNLIESFSVVPRCDLVLIRNVLIYFSEQAKLDILNRIRDKVLRSHGVVVLGGSELINDPAARYRIRSLARTSCYSPVLKS